MIVDMLLRLLGENPTDFPRVVDKQAIFLEHGINIFTFLLPFILLIVPIFWFYKKNSLERKRTKTIIFFILGCLIAVSLGLFIPELIKNLLMGYAVQSFYGGKI